MTHADSIPLSGPFRMTDALQRTFSVVLSAPLALFGLAFLILLPSTLMTAGRMFWLLRDPEVSEPLTVAYGCLETPVMMAAQLLTQAAVVLLVFSRLRGERSDVGRSLRVGLSRLLPLVGLVLLVALALFVGFVLCFVPGVVVYTCTFVAVPALLVEELRVTEAWQRSLDLTAGYRWEVFGVIFVIWVVGLALSGLNMAFWPGMFADPESLPSRTGVAALGGSLLVNLVSTVLTSVAAAVVYHDLRLTKEGLGEEELLAVFA